MRRIVFVVLVGIGGCAALIWLGVWQVQRLTWKEALLAEIETRIAADPVPLPEMPDPGADRYLPVLVAGSFEGEALRILASRKDLGAVWRLVQAFETDEGRRILVDRGAIPADGGAVPPPGPARIEGNLAWPRETDRFTPPPDPEQNIWYARDVDAMSAALGTEPVLVVARQPTGEGVIAWPIGTEGIPNDHLNYAVTWFSLAAIWLGMTWLWLLRIRRRTGEEQA